jgi:phenylacetate-CoA ligase
MQRSESPPAPFAPAYDKGMDSSFTERQRLRQLPREELRGHQLVRLNELLAAILSHNRFYAEKLATAGLPLRAWDELSRLPYTFKEELKGSSGGTEFAANLTWPVERYVRFHQTSGTRGRPMPVLDTAEDWEWWLQAWQYVLDAAEITSQDRILFPFSFGPFIGFWSAFEACLSRGCLAIPSGGMKTLARLELIRTSRATVFFCTPSYTMRMAEVAAENQIDPSALQVRRIIVSGEPGGSLPDVQKRISAVWNARVIDHAGASEVGPWGFADQEGRGLFINEAEFLPEFLSLATGGPAEEGELSELVLTGLGRAGSPVIRYRTGDLVRPVWNSSENEDCRFVLLEGGVIGRADDMLVVRGVNIFPSSIDQIVRAFPEVIEYRATVVRQGEMDALQVEIEDRLSDPSRVARELHLRLGLKVDVQCVPAGTLPRFEGKGKRFIDGRKGIT